MNNFKHLRCERDNYYWLYKKFWKFLTMDISKISIEPIRVSKSGVSLKIK